jgi:hypothetical protein
MRVLILFVIRTPQLYQPLSEECHIVAPMAHFVKLPNFSLSLKQSDAAIALQEDCFGPQQRDSQ